MSALAAVTATLAGCGMLIVGAGLLAVSRLAARRDSRPAGDRPAVTVLKPLCGDEPALHAALATIFAQTYPAYQIVFGVQDARDPALAVVERLCRDHPARDVAIVVDPTAHGPNRKIGNLINMLPAARHDTLVLSDSDLHVAPDYLERIVDALAEPGTGLVTSVCVGLPTAPGLAARLGASGISHSFLPGALIARAIGRQDCLGTTMALRRATLVRAGGLEALVRHLADDHVLAGRVRALGLRVGLARTAPLTAVPECSIRSLWQHELRWARTIGSIAPGLFALSAVQYPLVWAALTVALSGGAGWAIAGFAAAWALRAAAAARIDRVLGGALGDVRGGGRALRRTAIWLPPLRDALSLAVLVASYCGSTVVWRGHAMRADGGRWISSGRFGNRPGGDPGIASKPASAPAAG